jgi:uncharacterized DUF497 family protein
MAFETDLDFEWDEAKAVANLKKHKISFETAKTVFADSFSITINDPKHSVEEQRYIDIGAAFDGKILVVSYTQRGKKIRLISCRKSTKTERKIYEEREEF